MALKQVKDAVRVVSSEDGYELNGVLWTKFSPPISWADGVVYCANRGGSLQTLDEAVEFRHDGDGADGSKEYQHTGTLLAVDHDNRAHVYEPSLSELLLVASRSEVQERRPYFDVEADSEFGKAILDYSKSTGRSFVIPAKELMLSVNTDIQNESEYSKNEVVRKLMPRNAQKNALNIARAGYASGEVWFARSAPAKGYLRVHAVCLGNYGEVIYGLFAYDRFYNGGRARGVVHVCAQKISPDNK